jgi:hypothetical protein
VGRHAFTAAASGEGPNIALQQDGSVIVWENGWGGNVLENRVVHRYSNIIAVAAMNYGGFVVLREDGTVFAWAEPWVQEDVFELPVPLELQ